MSTKCTVEKQNNLLRLKESLMTKTTTNKLTKSILLGLIYRSRKILNKKVLDAKLCLVTNVYFYLTIYIHGCYKTLNVF